MAQYSYLNLCIQTRPRRPANDVQVQSGGFSPADLQACGPEPHYNTRPQMPDPNAYARHLLKHHDIDASTVENTPFLKLN